MELTDPSRALTLSLSAALRTKTPLSYGLKKNSTPPEILIDFPRTFFHQENLMLGPSRAELFFRKGLVMAHSGPGTPQGGAQAALFCPCSGHPACPCLCSGEERQ